MRPTSSIASLVSLIAISSIAEAQGARKAEAPPDFPCPGCVFRLPSRAPDGPRPLLVALHGDGGAMLPLVRAWQNACDDAGVILLAPRCPRELGCKTQSYWQWLASPGHDSSWLAGLIDAVARKHDVDPSRVYATGYSGGATYLGWYVPAHPARFAAVAHIAGGAPLGGACPSCKVPVLFEIGATDPMIEPYTEPLRRFYDACGGHEISWKTLPGVTHESILGHLQAGRASGILSWLLARPATCGQHVMDAGAPLVDAGPRIEDTPTIDTSPSALEDAGGIATSPPIQTPPQRGCACNTSASRDKDGLAALCGAIVVALRRTARVRSRARLVSMPS